MTRLHLRAAWLSDEEEFVSQIPNRPGHPYARPRRDQFIRQEKVQGTVSKGSWHEWRAIKRLAMCSSWVMPRCFLTLCLRNVLGSDIAAGARLYSTRFGFVPWLIPLSARSLGASVWDRSLSAPAGVSQTVVSLRFLDQAAAE